MARQQPWFAVRVAVYIEDGETFTRDYVRGERRMGQDGFASYALGDMLTVVLGWKPDTQVRWNVEEIDFETVRVNRRYQHTTHAE